MEESSVRPYFQQAMQSLVLKDLVGKDNCCCVYIDDVIVFGRTWETYMINLKRVLERFQEWGVLLKVSKCRFAVQEAKFLGHIVSKNGIKLDNAKKDEVNNLILPDTVTKLRSFLGLVNFFRDFIDHFAETSHVLYALLKGKMVKQEKIVWSSEAEQVSSRQ
jgi:hypothetical protein